MNNSIKQLELNFTGKGEVRGFKFTQLRQTVSAYLYEVNTGDSKYYEVFKKKINKRYDCISYPTSKAFGIWAWTYPNLNSAFVKLNEISPF
jgi:hypothetical protein